MVVVATQHTLAGLMIFPDHADGQQFYYIRATPQLAKEPDGNAAAQLLMYRSSNEQGGVFRLETTLAAAQEQLHQAARGLHERLKLNAPPRLAPLELLTARARFTLLGEQITTTPVGLHDGRAAFAMHMSAQTTVLLREMLNDLPPKVGVLYEAEFFGVRRAPNIEFTVDWGKVNEQLGAAFTTQQNTAGADIERAVDALVEHGIVQLTLLAGAENEAHAQHIAARRYLQEYITDAFFTPTPAAAVHHGLVYAYQPADEHRLRLLDINAPVARRRIVIGRSLVEMLNDHAASPPHIVAMIDLDDVYRTLDVTVTVNRPPEINWVRVDLEYGEHRTSVAPRGDQPVPVRWPFNPALGRRYRFRYQAGRRTGEVLETAWVETDHAMLMVVPEWPV
jgi:hypothetical protein